MVMAIKTRSAIGGIGGGPLGRFVDLAENGDLICNYSFVKFNSRNDAREGRMNHNGDFCSERALLSFAAD